MDLNIYLVLHIVFMSALTSTYPVAILLWSIVYRICDEAGYMPFSKFPTLILSGIIILGYQGSAMLFFKPTSMILFGMYQSMTGETIDILPYTAYRLIVGMVTIFAYMAVCKFIFHLDVSKIKNITDLVEREKMSRLQKVVSVFLIAFIVLAVLDGFLSDENVLGLLLSRVGAYGLVIGLVALMCVVRVDGKPVLSFPQIANKYIIWDILIILALIMPLSNMLMADDAGIKQWLIQALSPIISDANIVFFAILVLLLPVMLANVASSVVVAVIFTQLIISIAPIVGANPVPLIISMSGLTYLSFLTPAASGPSALLFANTDWLNPKDLSRCCGITIMVLSLVGFLCYFPLSGIFY